MEPADTQIVYSHDGTKVAIVSDLPAYFEQQPTESLHYSIDVSLRSEVHSTYAKAVEQGNPKFPLFLVIEECKDVPPTDLNNGECFTIDEWRDGEALIEGGREGKRALLAIKTTDGSWPDFHTDTHTVNVVLAAVKVEQKVTHHIERLYSCSCFVSREGRAIHALIPTMSAAIGTASRLEPRNIQEKANRLELTLQAMMSDPQPVVQELFDSMVMDKTRDDSYLRLWYLRLWQAVEDAKKHLGCPQLRNINTVIAGKRTPKDLYDYRTEIAHWYTAKINHSYLNDLQYTAIELLGRKYEAL